MNSSFQIYTEDTDWGGVVYHSNYLKFYERARSDFLRHKNITQIELKEKLNIAFVVSAMEIKFLKAAKMDDLININTKIDAIKNASIIMEQEIFCDNILINKAKVTLAIIDLKTRRPIRVPKLIIEAFK